MNKEVTEAKGKDVCINMKSIQKSEEGEDVTEFFTYGKMTKKSSDDYNVSYEETEANGYEGCTVVLEITKDEVRLTRTGDMVSNLIIQKGKKHHCHYETPYGEFMIGINANDIKNHITDNGGDLYLKYTIDINSGFFSENEMYINIKEC